MSLSCLGVLLGFLIMIQMQLSILLIVGDWVKDNKTPIPLSYIAKQKPDVEIRTLRAAMDALCRKGYLRKSCTRGYASYVRIRSF